MKNFQETIYNDKGGRIVKIKIKFLVKNSDKNTIRVTDMMLQGGDTATVWQPHPAELRWCN